LFSEFILFTCNDYKLGCVEGFLDAAWGFVDCGVFREKASDLDRIKPHVEQDIKVRDDMFNVGKVRTVIFPIHFGIPLAHCGYWTPFSHADMQRPSRL